MSLISRGKGGTRPSRLAAITFAGTLSVYLVLSFLTALPASAVTTCTFLAPTITLTIDTDDDAALENTGAIVGAVPAADVGFAVNGGAFATCGAGSGLATAITVTGTNSGSETLTIVELGTGFEPFDTSVDLGAGSDGFTLDYGSFTSGPDTIVETGSDDDTSTGDNATTDFFDLSSFGDGDIGLRNTESYTWNGGDGEDEFHSHASTTLDGVTPTGILSHGVTLNGENDDDEMESTDGNDTINGGPGSDEADYDNVTEPVAATPNGAVVDLVAGTSSGAGGSDVLVSIQEVEGSDSDDIITGNALDNRLTGNDGSDVIDGGALNDFVKGNAGPDLLIGGTGLDIVNGDDGADFLDEGAAASGSDVLDGGGGTDGVLYDLRTTNTIVTLDGGFVSGEDANANGIAEEGDSITTVENVFTGTGADTITGNAAANILDSDGGADTVVGLASQDDITGGDGDDVLNGSGGFDYSHYEDCAASIVADMAAGTVVGCSTDTIASIEGIVGTDFDDTFLDNTGVGEGPNDYLGGAGNDEFDQGAGPSTDADILQGDAGVDHANYGARTADVFIDLVGTSSCGGTPVVCTGVPFGFDFDDGEIAEFDHVDSTIENVTTGSGNDLIVAQPAAVVFSGGSVVDNTFVTGAGNDFVFGNDGADYFDLGIGNDNATGGNDGDTFLGDLGDDTMFGNDGNDHFLSNGAAPDGADTLNGGQGFDDANYELRTDDLNLANNGFFDDGAFGEGDGVFAMEQLTAGTGNDHLVGTVGGDILKGGQGNDDIAAAAGIDLLQGQGGDDHLIGARGSDTLRGGPGFDTGNGGPGRNTCTSVEDERNC